MPESLAVVAAIIAGLFAIVAAVVAGVFALMASRSTATNQRVLELEKRLATQRLEIYKPMLDALGAMMEPGDVKSQEKQRRQQNFMDAGKKFMTWVQVYGSDEAVRVYHRMMHASYASAPPLVLFRLYGQFVMAARRDIGDPATKVGIDDLLGTRIKDIYAGNMAEHMRLSDDDFYRQVGWEPPWERRSTLSRQEQQRQARADEQSDESGNERADEP